MRSHMTRETLMATIKRIKLNQSGITRNLRDDGHKERVLEAGDLEKVLSLVVPKGHSR